MNCNICELKCEIGHDSHGRCGMYQSVNGKIIPRYDNQLSQFSIGHIEDVPILHYHPGSLTLLMGTTGCNFDCGYCSNSNTAKCYGNHPFRFRLTPEELVAKTKAAGCRNIAFNVNEPAVSFSYFLNAARLARTNGISAGCATNGYYTAESARELAANIDFVNVSLKSIKDEFYRDVCKVPSVAPVLRNIELWHKRSVHLEITTPIIDEMEIEEVAQIARTISEISPAIPWHLFRLIPEYKMSDEKRPPMDDLLAMRSIAREYLDHVFIGNLVASQWLDTVCPQCGSTLIKRVNATGCGSIVSACKLKGGACPDCGRKVHVIGECAIDERGISKTTACPPNLLYGNEERMIGLLDAHGYRNVIDMCSGRETDFRSSLIEKVAGISQAHQYPGDACQEADNWVTEMALDLVNAYPADLIMLDYAQALFISANSPDDHEQAFSNVFQNINRFLSETDYEPLIIGCGGLERIESVIDLDGLLDAKQDFIISNGKYANIAETIMSNASPQQLKMLESISRVLNKKEFLNSLTEGYSLEFASNIGDYVAIANQGIIFKGVGSQGRTQYYTPALNDTIPVYTTLQQPDSIADVALIIQNAVSGGKKAALIIVEGAGIEDFPFSTGKCRNRSGALIYQTPWQQYVTLGTGIPYNKYRFPLSSKHWQQDKRTYPFSGKFYGPSKEAIGQHIGSKKSLAVGNRSTMTHVCLGADVSVECYCCYMHNYGSLAVFRSKALSDRESQRLTATDI